MLDLENLIQSVLKKTSPYQSDFDPITFRFAQQVYLPVSLAGISSLADSLAFWPILAMKSASKHAILY